MSRLDCPINVHGESSDALPPVTWRQGWEEHVLYAKKSLDSFGTMGAFAPTCRRVRKAVTELIPLGTETLLELGPGSGRLFRDVIVEGRLASHGLYGAIEIDGEFVAHMRRYNCNTHGVVIEGRAEDIRRHAAAIFGRGEKIQRICASLPFSHMRRNGADMQLLQDIAGLLTDDGLFIAYIFCDITQRLRRVWPYVDCRFINGQLLPPRPYCVQWAGTRELVGFGGYGQD